MPLQIECSSCGHQGTVPDDYVGKEVRCPKCQSLLVPLTADKMESFAAKVLFAAPGRREESKEEIIEAEASGPQVAFECPFCGEAYEVSEDLAGKKISCRRCREACKVDSPAKRKKRRKKRSKHIRQLAWLCVVLTLFSLFLGFILGRIFNS